MARNTDKIAVRSLSERLKTEFEVVPGAPKLAEIAAFLDLSGCAKTRMIGCLIPTGKGDWRLEATLGATVTQPCVLTNAPVRTRIDVSVNRLLLKSAPVVSEAAEMEFDGNDTWDLLGPEIDLAAILSETLALNIPQYPHAPGAALHQSTYTAPGAEPLDDQAVKPFASLAGLRAKLQEKS